MKKLRILLITILFVFVLNGCNYELDFNYTYDYGYILLPNGEYVEGKVETWSNYEDCEQIQVVIDGTTYLTDTTRCVLVKYGEADK